MENKRVDILGAPFSNKERNSDMKVSKSQAMLYIFNSLLEKGYLTKSEIMSELEISELAFWRDIQEIKAFFYNFNLYYDVVYDRKSQRYLLVKNLIAPSY